MSKLLNQAKTINANFALIVCKKNSDNIDYIKFYRRGTWEKSRNCLLAYNHHRERWENTSELSFSSIELGMKWTGRRYSVIDFDNMSRKKG